MMQWQAMQGSRSCPALPQRRLTPAQHSHTCQAGSGRGTATVRSLWCVLAAACGCVAVWIVCRCLQSAATTGQSADG